MTPIGSICYPTPRPMGFGREEKIGLVRVLAAAMWADGRVTHEERHFLRGVFNCLLLDREDWRRIEPLLASPVKEDEFEALTRDFVSQAGGRARKELRRRVAEMFRAEESLTEDERRWKNRLLNALEGGPGLMQALRAWFRRGTSERRSILRDFYDVEGFFKNRVLFHVRRRLREKNLSIPPHESRLELACLIGGLLGKIAFADGTLSDPERAVLQRHIRARQELTYEEAAALEAVIDDGLCRDLDAFRLADEFRDRVGYEDRLKLLEVLYECAAADGRITLSEQRQIDKLALHLRLDPRDSTEIRSRYWDRLER